MARLQNTVKTTLGAVSYRSAQRPWLTIGLCTLLSLVCMTGFVRIELESEGSRLWTDQNSDSMVNSDYVSDVFGDAPVMMRVLIQAKNRGENALTVDAFREAFDVADEILAQRSDEGDTFSDVCMTTGGLGCLGHGALRFFLSNRTVFESEVATQADLLSKVSRTDYPDDGEKVIRSAVFGSWSEDGAQITSAPVWRMDFVLQAGLGSDRVMDWEKKVLDTFVSSDDYLTTQRWEHIHVEIWSIGRSLDDELARTIGGDIMFMAIAYTFLITACALLLGDPLQSIKGRKVLGALDFFVVIFAMLAGYGLSSLFGVPFTSLQQILPFILVGIGVDDAFVITGAFDRTDRTKPVEERVRDAVMLEGMSVTLTSVTDILAFLCGATAAFPAVSYFCVYAGLSLFFIYWFHITAFCAMLALDARRQEANRLDVLCCITRTATDEEGQNVPVLREPLAERLMVKYTRFITSHILVKIAIMSVFLAFTGICLWQAIDETDTQFNIIDLAPDESYMRDFLEAENTYWGEDSTGLNIEVFLHFRGIDESDAEVQAKMRAIEDDFLQLSSINSGEGIQSWHRSFTDWARANEGQEQFLDAGNFATLDGQKYLTGSAFYSALDMWVGNCSLGCRFEDDIEPAGKKCSIANCGIRDSRVSARQVSTSDSDKLVDFLTEATDFNEEKDGILPGTFVFQEGYTFYDAYRIIRAELFQTTGMCFLAVVVVSLTIIAHPLAVLIVFGVVLLVFVDLLGCLPISGTSLNSISMINLVMAIGLVVDYSMHIAHGFMAQDPALSRDERTVLAMKEIGVAVAKGIFSTFIAILPLAFSTSEIFRVFFKLFLSILIVGGSHGLVFMPLVLSLVGPRAIQGFESLKEGQPGAPPKTVWS